MSNTTNLVLPYLAEGQAQKHVTVNESLRKLDALVQLTVVSASTTAEPGAPTDGQCYIVPSGKTGTNWASFTNWAIGYYRDGVWEQITPREGWLAFVKDVTQIWAFNGTDWDNVTAGALGTAAQEDIGTSGANVPLLSTGNTWTQLQTIGGSVGGHMLELRHTGASSWGTVQETKTVAGTDYPRQALEYYNGGSPKRWAYGPGNIDGSNGFGIYEDGYTGAPGTMRWGIKAGGDFVPGADNTQKVGNASYRASEVFAANGSINTSDAREKTPPRAPNTAELAAIRRIVAGIGLFQWKDAVARKGEDHARLHAGVTAQAVAEAFAAEGLDAARYGLFCADPVFEPYEIEPAKEVKGKDAKGRPTTTMAQAILGRRPILDSKTGQPLIRLGVRYDQLFALALAALVADIQG